MELLSVLSKFFNTAWHDLQLLFSYQTFLRTFLLRHCPKSSQACEWDFSLLDSFATDSPLRNNPLLSILRCQVVNTVEIWGIWSWFWCRRRISPLVTHTSCAFVQDYGVRYVFFPKKKYCFLEIREFCFLGFFIQNLCHILPHFLQVHLTYFWLLYNNFYITVVHNHNHLLSSSSKYLRILAQDKCFFSHLIEFLLFVLSPQHCLTFLILSTWLLVSISALD